MYNNYFFLDVGTDLYPVCIFGFMWTPRRMYKQYFFIFLYAVLIILDNYRRLSETSIVVSRHLLFNLKIRVYILYMFNIYYILYIIIIFMARTPDR